MLIFNNLKSQKARISECLFFLLLLLLLCVLLLKKTVVFEDEHVIRIVIMLLLLYVYICGLVGWLKHYYFMLH